MSDVILILMGCGVGAVGGFVMCCTALIALNPPPRNERRHNLGRRLAVSHPEWQLRA